MREALIAGVGETAVGKVPDLTGTQLYAQAVRRAVSDAGIELAAVDGLITGNARFEPYLYHADMLAEYLGIRPAHALTFNTGGSTTGQALAHAAGLIALGQCRHVVIVMADKLATGADRSAVVESMAGIGHPEFEAPFGPSIPALYALLAQRYVWEYGVQPEHIAEVAVVDREHARLGDAAQYRTELSAADVLASRLVADPLRLLECAPISDGGCAIVVSAADHAAGMSRPGVQMLGYAEARAYEHVVEAATLTRTAAAESGPKALAAAGVGPADVDVAMVYDAFAFILCMQLEDLGFCAKGEGGQFVAAGETRLGGRLPTNTHGGLLSHSHAGRPSSLFLLIEAVKQLRGDCGERQVADAEVALVHMEGGILASHCTAILGRA